MGSHLASSSSPVVFSLSLSLSPANLRSLSWKPECFVAWFLACLLCDVSHMHVGQRRFIWCFQNPPPPQPHTHIHTTKKKKKKKEKNTHQSEILSRSRGWVVMKVVLPRFTSSTLLLHNTRAAAAAVSSRFLLQHHKRTNVKAP